MLLKTFSQMELNEFFQEEMESDLFEGVDQMEKSQFIGNFFGWMRQAFAQREYPQKIEPKEEHKLTQQGNGQKHPYSIITAKVGGYPTQSIEEQKKGKE